MLNYLKTLKCAKRHHDRYKQNAYQNHSQHAQLMMHTYRHHCHDEYNYEDNPHIELKKYFKIICTSLWPSFGCIYLHSLQ